MQQVGEQEYENNLLLKYIYEERRKKESSTRGFNF